MDTIQALTEAARRLTPDELRRRLEAIDQESRIVRALLRARVRGELQELAIASPDGDCLSTVKRQCRDCKWWKSIPDTTGGTVEREPDGRCRRHAPSPFCLSHILKSVRAVNDTTLSASDNVTWPETAPDDSCGEFFPR